MTLPKILHRLYWVALIGILMLLGTNAAAQQPSITGTIVSGKEPAPNISIIAINGEGEQVGIATSDTDGKFALRNLPAGMLTLHTQRGDEFLQGSMQLYLSGHIELNWPMLDRNAVPSSRTVLASCMPRPAVAPLGFRQIHEIQGSRDPYSLIAAMESQAVHTEGTDILQLRGARPSGTAMMIDGVRLRGEYPLPFAALASIKLYTSGMPAEYGDATGGVIVVESRAPMDMGVGK